MKILKFQIKASGLLSGGAGGAGVHREGRHGGLQQVRQEHVKSTHGTFKPL